MMETFKCESINELAKAFEECGPNALFRGQTKEYLNTDLTPSIVTSFSRHGCIPERMLKWTHYSKALLESFVKNFEQTSDLAIDQAILQHYGWRSFFIDATSSPAVASWFAANRYNSQQAIELSEDCDELPLYKIRDYAKYEPHPGKGVVYAISRKSLRRNSINAVDLVEIPQCQNSCRSDRSEKMGAITGV
ncbi:FRG domain-containing protein [Pseudoduganella sp. R-31]|uniref:FRG domain-containing protein n=1 Tax=Pseudoduganella sp. R-31 TaxID=3404060 RepID=UPI003CF6DF83